MAVINTKHPLAFKLQMTEHHTKDQTGAYNINLQENAPFILLHIPTQMKPQNGSQTIFQPYQTNVLNFHMSESSFWYQSKKS